MSFELLEKSRKNSWLRIVRNHTEEIKGKAGLVVEGRITRMTGLTLEAVGCHAPVGGRCLVVSSDGKRHGVEAEVVGFSGERLYLMPTGNVQGFSPGDRVIPIQGVCEAPLSNGLIGRVVDGVGKPIDGRGKIKSELQMPIAGRPKNPLECRPVKEPLDVGVRSINALLTVGRGQRLGLFAGSGVGKSVLLGMMTLNTSADVVVVSLIGERGREVEAFVRETLGEEGMGRAVVVATPASDSPLMRLHGAMLATTIAEYFRDQGKDVLLLMDSLTRYAQAQREIALAIGEPPATKGYPPSVFAKIPQLVERAGNGKNGNGSITALYTVLVEGDDHNDPVVDSARAVLDGHIVLSRQLADAGQYPAIDIASSISRIMKDVVSAEQATAAQRFKGLFSIYQRNLDLISIGAYKMGSDPQVDEGIEFYPRLVKFLRQGLHEKGDIRSSQQDLFDLFSNPLQENP